MIDIMNEEYHCSHGHLLVRHLRCEIFWQRAHEQVSLSSKSKIFGGWLHKAQRRPLRAVFGICVLVIQLTVMSQFRIQRKLTEGSSVKLKPSLPNPQRIRSLESKHSLTRSPKKMDSSELRKMIRKVSFKDPSQLKSEQRERLQQGMQAFREKNVERAVQIFKELRRGGDRSAEVSYYLGSCLLNLGKHQSSIVHLNECLLQNDRFSPNAYLYIAINFKLLGNLRQAIRILEKAAAVFPTFEEGLLYRGKLAMRVGQWEQAMEALSKCTQLNPANDLAILFLGDCLKATGRAEKAAEKYRQVLLKGNKHRELAVPRIAGLLLEQGGAEELCCLLREAVSVLEHPEGCYYMGISCWSTGKKNEAVVYLESCLSASQEAKVASRALKALIRIAVEEGNFFQAEHHISRIDKLELNSDGFREWSLFVEGANDLIKRKNEVALEKILKALVLQQGKQGANALEAASFRKNAYPYAAYALYLNNRHAEAVEMYEKALQLQNHLRSRYCKLVVEGISLHCLGKHHEAADCFQEAYSQQNTIEALFLACIALVQGHRQKEKKGELQKIEGLLLRGSLLDPKAALFHFYYALVLMYQDKPCLPVIETAIKACEEPVSEYFFIEALALQSEGKLRRALESITRAIQLDPGIEEFYRERSKYYFMAQDYGSAIEDCRRAQEMAPDDDELPLLLAFYHYLADDFLKAYNYLLRARPTGGKLVEFQQALQLRLGMDDKLGQIGQILIAMKLGTVSEQLLVPLETFITERYQFSEFSVYFYHLLLAVSYAHLRLPQQALTHLFGCLEEIQLLVDQRESKQAVHEVSWEETEEMLDEVKFNIVIVSLLKQDPQETRHFIQIFISETESEELKQTFLQIASLLDTLQASGEIRLIAEDDYPRISDRFPLMRVQVGKQTVVARLLMSYPVKLKFTITPEFDPSYLLNFDIDKLEYPLPPPWLAAPARLNRFTQSIRNDSVLLTDSQATQRRQSQATDRKPSQKSVRSIRERLKLGKDVEQKLKKIIEK